MITIDQAKCIGCGVCVKDCFPKYLALADGKAVVKGQRCILCGHCYAACPSEAIQIRAYQDVDPMPAFASGGIASDDLLALMASRRTIRQFKKTELPPVVIERLLQAGRISPTGVNRQKVRFIVLRRDKEAVIDLTVAALRELAKKQPDHPYVPTFRAMAMGRAKGGDGLFYHAPAVVIVVQGTVSSEADGALAASRIELMAHTMGLGVCLNGFFVTAASAAPEIGEAIGVRADEKIVLAMAVGYPAISYKRVAPRENTKIDWR